MLAQTTKSACGVGGVVGAGALGGSVVSKAIVDGVEVGRRE